MRIAVLAPISWRVPPRHYGPWEQFVSLLTEGLVSRGVDVTLFATADSVTSAQLVGVALEKPLLTFNEVGQDQGEIITHVEHLTARINESVFNVAPVVPPSPAAPAARSSHGTDTHHPAHCRPVRGKGARAHHKLQASAAV